jgi:predicted ester cyclase
MSAIENKALIERLFAERNAGRGDPAKVRAVWEKYNAPDYVRHHASTPDMNLEQQIQSALALWAGFPDLTNRADAMVAEGDEVWVRYTAEGTHKGQFRGIAPTGKSVVIRGIEIHRIAQGKIVEAWSYADPTWTAQIGSVP